MLFHLEQRHINNGMRNSCGLCPVAMVVQEAGYKYPTVDVEDVAGYKDGHLVIGNCPPEVQKFIKDFDAGRPVKPFSFELDLQ